MKRFIILIITFSISFYTFADTDKKIWKIIADIGDIGCLNFYMFTEESDSTLYLKSPENRDKKLIGTFKATILRTMQKRKNKSSIATIEMEENGLIHFLTMQLRIKNIEYLPDDSIKGNIVLTDSENVVGTIIAKKRKFLSIICKKFGIIIK
jgi:hypothetical protein